MIDRKGEVNYNTFGTQMKIIEYKRSDDITVEFQDEHRAKIHTQYYSFKNGKVINPYDKCIYNVGCIGLGKYNYKDNSYIYDVWSKMLKRCYNPYWINKHPTYIDCYVCKEWLCFQNFAKWYEENYYEVFEERMNLDKDILYKGNKVYSPKTCIIVSERINKLFTKSDGARGEYPIGVDYCKKEKRFRARCSILDINGKKRNKHLGMYNTSEEAFLAYKTFKENYIKQVADEYKDLIPRELYDAMRKWEVEIND